MPTANLELQHIAVNRTDWLAGLQFDGWVLDTIYVNLMICFADSWQAVVVLLPFENRVFPQPNFYVYHSPSAFNVGFATISAGDDGGFPLSHRALRAGACRTARTMPGSSGWRHSLPKWDCFSIAMSHHSGEITGGCLISCPDQDWTSWAEDRALEDSMMRVAGVA